MPILYRDFVPAQIAPGGFLTPGRYAQLDDAVRQANAWVRQSGVRVLNFETIVLPNPFNPGEEGTADSNLRTSGDMSAYWTQFVRVWYITAEGDSPNVPDAPTSIAG